MKASMGTTTTEAATMEEVTIVMITLDGVRDRRKEPLLLREPIRTLFILLTLAALLLQPLLLLKTLRSRSLLPLITSNLKHSFPLIFFLNRFKC